MADDEALVDVVSLKPPSVATIAAAIAVQLAALFTTGVVASYVAALLVVKVGIGSVPLFVGGPLLLAGVFAWILSAPTTSLRYRIAMIVVCGAIALGLLASCGSPAGALQRRSRRPRRDSVDRLYRRRSSGLRCRSARGVHAIPVVETPLGEPAAGAAAPHAQAVTEARRRVLKEADEPEAEHQSSRRGKRTTEPYSASSNFVRSPVTISAPAGTIHHERG